MSDERKQDNNGSTPDIVGNPAVRSKMLISTEYPSSLFARRRTQADAWEVVAQQADYNEFAEIVRRVGITVESQEGAHEILGRSGVADFTVTGISEATTLIEVKGIPSSAKVADPVEGVGVAVVEEDKPQVTGVISSPPGVWMDAIAGTVFSPKIKERIFDQVLADFRLEYFEALSKRAGHARMFFVVARHWWGFIQACLEEAATGIGRIWRKIRGA